MRTEITNANKLQIIEDLYRPYKQKRRTRATVAKEKGLEPLAEWMMSFPTTGNLKEYAAQFVSEEKEVVDFTEAINGAKDIIAEQISDDASIRQWVRKETFQSGNMITSVKNEEKDEKKVFEMYYEYEEPVKRIVPHRTLALNRGEKEDILRVSVKPDTERIVQYLNNRFIKNSQSIVAAEVMEAVEDGYKRLIEPSIEREIRNELTEKAEDQAIHIFSENLRKLLLQPPLKGKIVLGVDPAYRSGCSWQLSMKRARCFI